MIKKEKRNKLTLAYKLNQISFIICGLSKIRDFIHSESFWPLAAAALFSFLSKVAFI